MIEKTASGGFLGGLQRAFQVDEQVVGILQAYGQAYRALAYAGGGQRLVAQAEVRGAGGVDHQAAAVAHIGQVAEELERLDEGLALGAAAPS